SSTRRGHTRSLCDWSSDVCSSDLERRATESPAEEEPAPQRVERELRDEQDKRETDLLGRSCSPDQPGGNGHQEIQQRPYGSEHLAGRRPNGTVEVQENRPRLD